MLSDSTDSTLAANKYQFSVADMDVHLLPNVNSFVLNMIHRDVLPQMAQAYNIPVLLLHVADISLVKLSNGISSSLLGSYLTGGQLASVIPLRRHKSAVLIADGTELDGTAVKRAAHTMVDSVESGGAGYYFTPQLLNTITHRLFEHTEYLLIVEVSFGYFNSCQDLKNKRQQGGERDHHRGAQSDIEDPTETLSENEVSGGVTKEVFEAVQVEEQDDDDSEGEDDDAL
eukprot:gene26678-33297_t